jgi:acetoin utilization deacetylase AcuC-like enzyme
MNTTNLSDTPYSLVHSKGLLDFLSTSWKRWDDLGEEGQDPLSTLKRKLDDLDGPPTNQKTTTLPLIPGNVPLMRDAHERPSTNVMGQIGWYCNDTCTPVFAELLEELLYDLQTIELAIKKLKVFKTVYALCTHPGHHASYDCFGGYCYVNHAALAAKLLQEQVKTTTTTTTTKPKVCILDIDYHCGNGSASIFCDDPSVLVVSIHCHPDYEYVSYSAGRR